MINYSSASTPELSSDLCYYYRPWSDGTLRCKENNFNFIENGRGHYGARGKACYDAWETEKLQTEGQCALIELSSSHLQLPKLSHTPPFIPLFLLICTIFSFPSCPSSFAIILYGQPNLVPLCPCIQLMCVPLHVSLSAPTVALSCSHNPLFLSLAEEVPG